MGVVAIVLIAVLVPVSLKRVNFDEVGLEYDTLERSLSMDELLLEGLHNVGPTGTLLRYETTQQEVTLSGVQALTSDGLSVTLDVIVSHTVTATLESVLAIQHLYGSQDGYNAYVSSRAEWVLRNEAARHAATFFYAQRQAFEAGLFLAYQQMFNATWMHSSLNRALVVNVKLPRSVEAVLVEVATSQQDIANAEAERPLQVRLAQIAVSLARSQASITLLVAQRHVAAIELERDETVTALQTEYAARATVWSNASAALGVSGDDFVQAYVMPWVYTSNRVRAIVRV